MSAEKASNYTTQSAKLAFKHGGNTQNVQVCHLNDYTHLFSYSLLTSALCFVFNNLPFTCILICLVTTTLLPSNCKSKRRVLQAFSKETLCWRYFHMKSRFFSLYLHCIFMEKVTTMIQFRLLLIDNLILNKISRFNETHIKNGLAVWLPQHIFYFYAPRCSFPK